MSDHVIEFNGKRYDASSGVYLGRSHVVPRHITQRTVRGRSIKNFFLGMQPTPAKEEQKAEEPKKAPEESETVIIPVKIKKNGKVVVASPAKTPEAAAPVKTVVAKASRPAAPKPKKPITQPNILKAHRPEHAKTLVRRHMEKPRFAMKPGINKVRTPASAIAKQHAALAIQKHSAYSINPIRQFRATQTDKHPAIKHFTDPTEPPKPGIHAIPAEVPVIAVQPVPLPLQPARPAIAPHPAKSHSDVFANAIAKATSHEQPAPAIRRKHSRKRKVLNALAVTAAVLVVGGLIGYVNKPGIEMRIASFRAGFNASLPTYAPTGYAIKGGVERSGSTIAVSFRSGDQSYRVTQQPSNWNSQTLREDTLGASTTFTTVQHNGQIIYIYENENGGTHAFWVNGGVRYDLTGNAHLSQNEIISIATSL